MYKAEKFCEHCQRYERELHREHLAEMVLPYALGFAAGAVATIIYVIVRFF